MPFYIVSSYVSIIFDDDSPEDERLTLKDSS